MASENNNPNISIRCLVVDDEPLAARLISAYVERTPFLKLQAVLTSAMEVMEYLKDNDTDLIFLDIHMPRLSGMDLARMLPETTRVVFVTAYDNYALDGFKVNALDYLLKPVSYDEFMRSANRALHEAEARAAVQTPQLEALSKSGDYLVVKSEYRLVRIPIAEIEFVEGLKDYVKIFVKDTQAPVLTLMSMKTVEQMLPDGMFMRVHRSYIVNLERVRVIERNRIVLGDQYVPVSETYRRQFFEAIGLPGD